MDLTIAGATCLTAMVFVVLAVFYCIAAADGQPNRRKTYARFGWALVTVGAAGMIVSIWLAYAGL